MQLPKLYAILDAAQAGERPVAALAESLLRAGVRALQYRDKGSPTRQLFERCRQLAVLAGSYRSLFIVNDRADVALLTGAAGVHLGQDDLPVELARALLPPGSVIGLSTHNLAQVRAGEATSADYLAIGPVFPTESKKQADPVVGLAGVQQARQATRKPLVAIGGITLENAPSVIAAGADAVAVIGDLLRAPDIEQRAREFLATLEG